MVGCCEERRGKGTDHRGQSLDRHFDASTEPTGRRQQHLISRHSVRLSLGGMAGRGRPSDYEAEAGRQEDWFDHTVGQEQTEAKHLLLGAT